MFFHEGLRRAQSEGSRRRDVKGQRSCREGSCFARWEGKRATHFRRYFPAKHLPGAKRRFPCRRHASLEKTSFCPRGQKLVFSCHVNPMDQFPSWWHKTVTQRSGHSFEARSSGASSHFVPLHHDPATRSRCRSEETPRPAKRPRRKAGARAKRGVSELCFRYTIDEHITVTDFCNLFFRLVFTRNLIGRFNQICHDLIELRGVF